MPKSFKLGLAVSAIALMAAGCSSSTSPRPSASQDSGAQTPPVVQEQNPAPQTQGELKTFTVNGNNFAFDVKEIKVKQGDRVRIVFNNTGGFHDWVVDEFNVRTKQIGDGQSETIEFTADKTGTFEYYCSVGKHREMGMKGNLIVE